MGTKERYYSLKNILAKNADYNLVIGERSNGKSYSVHEYGLDIYLKTGKQMAIIRRWAMDFKGKRGQETFAGLQKSYNGKKISDMSKGEWEFIYYYSGRWYLARRDKDSIIRDEKPFCYAFALTEIEHDKSSSYEDVTTILFDEFISKEGYLPDEFVTFQNCLSTIIRDRNDVKIFMLGNTVNRFCPYFGEMGLYKVKDMEQGTIDVYKYGDTEMTVAIEFAQSSEKRGFKKKSDDKYFAFDNPKLKMIKEGVWEIDIYPHCPYKYKDSNIQFIYFIVFNGITLQCEIIKLEEPKCRFTYIHIKTSELYHKRNDIVFQEEYSPLKNLRRRIDKPIDEIGKLIYRFFQTDKVFYQNNEIGEVVNNYLNWCKQQ